MPGLDSLEATFTTATAAAAGVRFPDLYAARDSGIVIELSRGVFRKADAPAATYPDLLAVAYRVPRAVVCLFSAAAVHDLTDELPQAVQLAVPRGTWPPRITHPPVQVFAWNPATFQLGIGSIEAAPAEPVQVYTPERTVVDLMRLRGRLGEPPAHIALRRYLSHPGARIGELVDLARALDVLGPIRAAIDVLTAS